jgi:tetratricopeptide (TPR) repeat protein
VPKPPRLETKPLDFGTPTVSGTAAAPGTEATLQSLRSAPPAAGLAEPKSGLHPKPILAPLVPEPTEPPPASPIPTSSVVKPSRSAGAADPSAPATENADLGFSLEFESSPRTSSGKSPVAIPFPAARVASEGMAEAAAAKAEVPHLAPPNMRSAQAGRGNRPMARKRRVPRWAYFAGGAVVLAAAGVGVGLPLMHSAPNADNVVRPFLPELAKDSLIAYQQAATTLNAIAAKYKDGGVKLRLKAAELLLIASAAHGGGPNDGATGEGALAGTANQPKLAPTAKRIRALVALANGKPAEVGKLLADPASPDDQLVLGLARLAEDKLPAAVTHLRAVVAARPDDLLGHYLLGRALATGPDARKAYELVLAKNAVHPGAQIGLAQLEPTPEKRLAAAQALAEKKPVGAGPRELGWLQLVIGQASHALGKSAEAADAYQRAITHDKRLTAAFIALGEVLLYEGKYPAAIERLKAAGAPLEASAAGKFALGGATIATGDFPKGLGLVAAAAKERPDDPRGPFWTAFAATTKQPPDFAAGEQGFRDAIKKDPKFLPASLKLAAILQQQNRAQDSLTVLRAAEEAGAPPSLLQLAWGEALIIAGEPAKAQAVFEKALEADPKSVTALVGIAASLEAQGKLEEAKVSLERTLKSFPQSLGLRERLAQVYLKLGQKAEALAHYQAEIQAGHPTVTIRLAVARLALDLDKVELAQSEAKRVLDQSPRSAEAAYYLARVYESRNSNGLALTEYRHATTWGNTPLYALAYGRLLDKLGKQQEALASFANAVALPEGLVARGKIHFRNSDIANALADFEAAIKMNPKNSEPIILQALCYEKLGQSAKADESWRMALKVDPESPEPHYRLGRTEMDRAKLSAAIDHFQKAMAKAPEDAPYLPDLCFQLAQAHLLNGAKTAALATFKKYLDIAPPNAPARPEASRQISQLGGRGGAGQPNELFDNQRLRKTK